LSVFPVNCKICEVQKDGGSSSKGKTRRTNRVGGSD